MSKVRKRKTARFGLGEIKAEATGNAERLMEAALQLVDNEQLAEQEHGSVESEHQPPVASTPANSLDAKKPIYTQRRVRQELETSTQFNQKCGVTYLKRWKKMHQHDPTLVGRDSLEEALDYLFQKYNVPEVE